MADVLVIFFDEPKLIQCKNMWGELNENEIHVFRPTSDCELLFYFQDITQGEGGIIDMSKIWSDLFVAFLDIHWMTTPSLITEPTKPYMRYRKYLKVTGYLPPTVFSYIWYVEDLYYGSYICMAGSKDGRYLANDEIFFSSMKHKSCRRM